MAPPCAEITDSSTVTHALEVNIGPPQSAGFASPHPCGRDDADKGAETLIVSRRCLQQCLHFRQLRRTHLVWPLVHGPGGKFGLGDWVRKRSSTPLASQLACPVHEGAHLANRGLAGAFTLQMPEVPLHVIGIERCDTPGADRIFDVTIPGALVAQRRLGGEILPTVGLPRRDGVVDRRGRSPHGRFFRDCSREQLLFGHESRQLPIGCAPNLGSFGEGAGPAHCCPDRGRPEAARCPYPESVACFPTRFLLPSQRRCWLFCWLF